MWGMHVYLRRRDALGPGAATLTVCKTVDSASNAPHKSWLRICFDSVCTKQGVGTFHLPCRTCYSIPNADSRLFFIRQRSNASAPSHVCYHVQSCVEELGSLGIDFFCVVNIQVVWVWRVWMGCGWRGSGGCASSVFGGSCQMAAWRPWQLVHFASIKEWTRPGDLSCYLGDSSDIWTLTWILMQ